MTNKSISFHKYDPNQKYLESAQIPMGLYADNVQSNMPDKVIGERMLRNFETSLLSERTLIIPEGISPPLLPVGDIIEFAIAYETSFQDDQDEEEGFSTQYGAEIPLTRIFRRE
jgi:hypothetical protein